MQRETDNDIMRSLFNIAAVVLAFAACTGAPKSGERRVMVSIEPLRWAAEQVVDSSWTVDVLVAGGSNPETYEPTAQDMIKVGRAEYCFHTGGLGFELSSMERMKQNAPDTRFVSLGHSHNHGGHRCDPHVWASPRGMMKILDVMSRTMECEADRTEVLSADSLLRLVPRGTAFAIYHPSLTQLADDYGLRQICIEAEGKEPTPAQLARTIDECRSAGVRVVFLQQEFDRRGVEQVASQIGAQVVTINPLGRDWPGEMRKIYEALTATR